MKHIKRLATRAPLAFGVVVTMAFVAMVIVATIVANRWPAESKGWFLTNAAGRVVASGVLLVLVAGLGWTRQVGLIRPGRGGAWLVALAVLVYTILTSSYAMTGRAALPLSAPLPAAAALFLPLHVLLEEVAFRGLVLVALTEAWGRSRWGVLLSVLASALLFAAMHLINAFGGFQLALVLLQSSGAFFLGILLGGLVLFAGSLYPAVILHALANVATFLALSANPGAGTAAERWLVQTLLMAPLALLGLALLGRSGEPASVRGGAQRMMT